MVSDGVESIKALFNLTTQDCAALFSRTQLNNLVNIKLSSRTHSPWPHVYSIYQISAIRPETEIHI